MTNFLIIGITILVFMTIVFLIARHINRYDLVDAAWGGGFIVAGLTSFFLGGAGEGGLIDLIVTTIVILWGTRLSFHIFKRIRNTRSEDPRYLELRKNWRGSKALNMYIRVYVLQAILILLISVPVLHINLFNPGTGQWLDVFRLFGAESIGLVIDAMLLLVLVGTVLWLVGFFFESVADRQLRKFVSNPKNKGELMTSGLWRYSRHPNYFGELVQWWAIFIICLSTSFGWVGIISPLLISYLILFVSGIPPNENRSQRKPGWADYKRRTSIFFPLPSKS